MQGHEVAGLRAISSDSKLAVADIDQWLHLIEVERAELLEIQAEIEASAPPKHVLLEQRERLAAVATRDDLWLVANGVSGSAGVTNPRLADRVGKPGLLELSDVEMRLKAMREKRAAYEALWAGRKSLPHRYIGPHQKTLWDAKRFLEPGDVVELNERQALAFRDRFELLPPDHQSPATSPAATT